MRRLLLFLATCGLGLSVLFAQSSVSGTVTDAQTGDALEGVAVLVKGTTVGMFTDANGKYALEVPANSEILVFTFVGKKKQEIAIAGRRTIDLAMEQDILEIDEVVVTAFGIERDKRSLTSAVQEVKGSALVSSRETNIVSALSGKVAGVQVTSSSGAPGASSNIVIRGYSSLTGNNQPLFVIDGVPISNDQTTTGESVLGGENLSNRAIDINPEDIADISVLKGPGAAALYGSRASNGVIIITTKKGGKQGGGMQFSYNTALSFDEINKVPELNTAYAQGFDGALAGRISTSWGPLLSDLSYDGNEASDYSPYGMIVLKTAANATGQAVVAADPYKFFQTGRKWDNNFTMSGGDMNTNFILSASNTAQTGIMPNSEFNRTSIRTAGQARLNDKLTVSSSLTYTYTDMTSLQQGSNVNGIMLGLLRTPPSFDNSKGQETVDLDNRAAFMNANGRQRNYRAGGGYDNPYWTAWMNPTTGQVNRMNGYALLSYKPLSWLEFRYRLGADSWTDVRKSVYALYSAGGYASGRITEQTSRWFEVNSDFFIEATHRFTEDFGGRLMLGNNLNHRFSQTTRAVGAGLTIPEFYNLSNASTFTAAEGQSTIRLAGLFADLALDYKGMLYLNLSGRNDWASTFGENNNNFFYPSASLAFIFTEAFGLSKGTFLPFGKIRASYATAGKEPGPYLLNTVFVGGGAGSGFISGVAAPFLGQNLFTLDGTLGNPDLLPEQTTTLEFGIDLRFLSGRIGMDVTYYNSVSEGQIIGAQIPTSSGFFSTVVNAGTVVNNGIEAVVTLNPIRSNNNGFNWDITANFTRNVSEVTELIDDLEFLSISSNFVGAGNYVVLNQPFGVLYGSQWSKTSDGQLIIEDNTGFPRQDPQEGILGNPNPDWLLGVTNTFSWKGLSLSGLLDVRKGGDIWNGTRGALDYFGMSKTSEIERTENRVAVFEGVLASSYDGNEDTPSEWKANDIAVPMNMNWHFGGPGSGFTGPTESYIEDGSWIRLREITLAYSLPKSLLDKTPLGAVDVSITGRNQYLYTNYQGIDPETSLKGASNGQGFDYFNSPNTKSWVGAIRISF
ncbi:MAG: SusC/RagA family TonB-linked outer membrane protein [Bacteroidia bacterium]|nr:SusC/RagA family TonB-linked outer membrane protein [Bacteroidia bacterium]